MSSLKHGVIRWVKRTTSNVDREHGNHTTPQRRPTLTKILEYARLRKRPPKRIDFVGELPLDIVTLTLIPMFMDYYVDPWGPCVYLDVSQRWRDRIFQCFQGLHFWVPDEGHLMTRSEQLAQYPQLANELYIEWYGLWWMDQLLRKGNFCSLRALDVNGPNATKDSFLPTLKSVGMTLRHLTIRRMHVSLHDLLLACPNLASLTLHENYNFDFKCITLTTWPTLTALSIPDISGHVAYDEMAQICKSFPSLQKLELYNCADMQCVFLVTDSFPSLTYLSLDISSFGVTIKSSNRGKRHDGITHLDICGSITPNVTSKVIFSLLKQHHTTLERLKWRMHVDRDAHDVFSIAYPRLKILLLGGSGSWIPRNAPLLEEMEITYGTIDHHPNLQDFIPAKLKKLKMDFWPHDKLQHTTFITRYFHRYSARPNTTYFLNELIIHTFYKMENAEILFEGICHLTQLERLVIFYLDWNASEMETFIDQLANGCHRLSCLKLFTRVMPSPHAVHALKPLEHLNHLAFDIEDKDHTEGRFWDAIETLNQVKRIEVYCLKMTQLLEIRRVKAKRPDMEVVVKTKHRLPSDLYL